MPLISDIWQPSPGMILERIESEVKGLFKKRQHRFQLAVNTLAFIYIAGKYDRICDTPEIKHEVKGAHEIQFVFTGPFELPFTICDLESRNGKTDCRLKIFCSIGKNSTDIEVFRRFCEHKTKMFTDDLAEEFTDLLRTVVQETIYPYSYAELKSGEANIEVALGHRIKENLTTALNRWGLKFHRLADLSFENIAYDEAERIRQKAEEYRRSRKLRETLDAEKLNAAKSEKELKQRLQQIHAAARERELADQHRLRQFEKDLESEGLKREEARKYMLKLEELRHQHELEKMRIEQDRKISEQELGEKLRHLEKLHKSQQQALEEKLDVYRRIEETVNAIDSGKVADIESVLSRLSAHLDQMPKDVMEMIEDTVGKTFIRFNAKIDELLASRLAGERWEATKTLLQGEAKPQVFNLSIWAEINGNRVKNVDVRPGDRVRFYIESNRSGYLTLFDMATDGNIIQIFPNDAAPKNFIQGGKIYSVFELINGSNQDPLEPNDFIFDPDTKFGVERIQAFVTLEPTDLRQFFLDVRNVRIHNGQPATDESIDLSDYTRGIQRVRHRASKLNVLTLVEDYLEFRVQN